MEDFKNVKILTKDYKVKTGKGSNQRNAINLQKLILKKQRYINYLTKNLK